MGRIVAIAVVILASASACPRVNAMENSDDVYPIGKPGLRLVYRSKTKEMPGSLVRNFELVLGCVEEHEGRLAQWFQLNAEKEDKRNFTVWILASAYPSASLQTAQDEILRYFLCRADSTSLEFVDQDHGTPVLPNTGAWKYLLPRSENGDAPFASLARRLKYLGHEYSLDGHEQVGGSTVPRDVAEIHLTPDLLIGVPHNSKMKDETRRYDESDYEYIELTRKDYSEMIESGINVFRVNAEQSKWLETENVYYWGIGGKDVSYPEHLYQSNYLGPALYFDEPMVHASEYVLKPRFMEDPALRKRVTPEMFFEVFKQEYHEAKYRRSPTELLKGLAQRNDVDLGDMVFLQQNVYSWETMLSSALYQMSEGDMSTPSAIVFEPPGRFGAKRVLPELNMCFDCQIPVDDPKNLIGIVKGFTRGAARVTDKEWGISIYGQVVRSEAYWFMTHAYEQGATHFYYYDSYQLAAVPYNEYLSLSKNLREHAKNFPKRDLEKLRNAAEIAIVLPVGYNLGHVKMGIGNFGGLPELNMERRNECGVKYRDVMDNFYVEIERCIRLGVEYDLFWNLDDLQLTGYREIVTIKKDGSVEVTKDGKSEVLASARMPARPDGDPPQLSVEIDTVGERAPSTVTARAKVTEGSAPVYYTQGAGKDGIYRNTYVLWELYGPENEDYTDFWYDRWDVMVSENGDSAAVEIEFRIDEPGTYRLRVSTSDVAGRRKVVWKNINIAE